MAVYTNMSDKAVRLGETHVGWSNEAKSIATYTTTGSKNLVGRNGGGRQAGDSGSQECDNRGV